jgi:hypothetical protein
MGLLLSSLAFLAAYLGARRSIGAGMVAVLTAGYLYGFLRARFFDGFSHFIFDAAVLGLYLGHLSRTGTLRPPHAPALYQWVTSLLAWPVVIFGLGVLYPQHMLIQLVGLRAAVWFLPLLLLGGWARLADLTPVARAIAVLNLVALLVAVGEYFLGLEAFLPRNAVTELMYMSKDVAGFKEHRIPATFISAGAYGGVMVGGIPFLVGRWLAARDRSPEKLLLVAALLAAVVGTFLCGSRTPVLFVIVLGLATVYKLRTKLSYLVPVAFVVLVVWHVVSGSERLQRFSTLQDTEMVMDRFSGSTNVGVLELLLTYPMGAGLGSAFGTSIPSFLQHLSPLEGIGAENEYARIGIEQSLVGVSLWLAFLAWMVTKRRIRLPGGWEVAGHLMLVYVVLSWVSAATGCGMLMSIPGTCLLLFQMGLLGKSPVPTTSSQDAVRFPKGPFARLALPASGPGTPVGGRR